MKKKEQQIEKEEQQTETEETYDYWKEYEKRPQLLNMALDPDDDKDYIIDLEVKDNKIVITYADGTEKIEEGCSKHNLNFWRHRVIDQINEYYDAYEEQGGKEAFNLAKKEVLTLLAPIAGGIVIHLASQFFLQYNIDIHISIKIILESLIILNSLKNTLFFYLDMSRIGGLLMEGARYKKYADLSRDLEYYDREADEYDFVMPVEDTWKHRVSEKQMEEISEHAVRIKKELGNDLAGFDLTYKRNEGPKL